MIVTIFVSFIVLRTSQYKEALILEEKNFKEAIFYNTLLDGVLINHARSKIIFNCNNSILQLFELNNNEQIIGTDSNEWFRKDYTYKIGCY